MIERRADWKHAEQSDARFFPTISPSAIGERRAGCPPLHPSTIAPIVWASPARARGAIPLPTNHRYLSSCFASPNNVFLITAFNCVAYFRQDRVSQITRPQYSLGHTTMTGRSANSDALLVRASPK
jgi:hypothetical protein